MRKLLGIVVLGLLLSGNAYAKEIYLNCESYKLITYHKNGKIEVTKGFPMERTFKINTSKKKIFELSVVGNFYIDLSQDNLKWGKDFIKWDSHIKKLSEDYSAFTTYSTLNRVTLDLEKSTLYENDKNYKKQDEFNKCELVDKKF